MTKKIEYVFTIKHVVPVKEDMDTNLIHLSYGDFTATCLEGLLKENEIVGTVSCEGYNVIED